jgi:mannonate dehydratase
MRSASRRQAMKAFGAAAVAARMAPAIGRSGRPSMGRESARTPKICLEIGGANLAADGLSDAAMRRVKQLGVDHVLRGGSDIPWQKDQIRSIMNRLESGGLTLGNMMIGGFTNTLYGRPGRD